MSGLQSRLGHGRDRCTARILTSSPYSNSAGTNTDPYTRQSGDREVDWGASSYAPDRNGLHESNYLSWYHNPPTTFRNAPDRHRQGRHAKTCWVPSRTSMSASCGFTTMQGGPVTHAIQDLDTNRADAVATLLLMLFRPVRLDAACPRRMYEAALYWRGMDRRVRRHLGYTDQDGRWIAWDSDDGWINYKQRGSEYACSKNFVGAADGRRTDAGCRASSQSRTEQLPGFGRSVMGTTACMGAGGSRFSNSQRCVPR